MMSIIHETHDEEYYNTIIFLNNDKKSLGQYLSTGNHQRTRKWILSIKGMRSNDVNMSNKFK